MYWSSSRSIKIHVYGWKKTIYYDENDNILISYCYVGDKEKFLTKNSYISTKSSKDYNGGKNGSNYSKRWISKKIYVLI